MNETQNFEMQHTYALPFADPTVFGAHHRNQTIEIVARAIVYIVFVIFHS